MAFNASGPHGTATDDRGLPSAGFASVPCCQTRCSWPLHHSTSSCGPAAIDVTRAARVSSSAVCAALDLRTTAWHPGMRSSRHRRHPRSLSTLGNPAFMGRRSVLRRVAKDPTSSEEECATCDGRSSRPAFCVQGADLPATVEFVDPWGAEAWRVADEKPRRIATGKSVAKHDHLKNIRGPAPDHFERRRLFDRGTTLLLLRA